MAVPKHKKSKSKTHMHRSHLAIKEPKHIGVCSNPDCKQPVASHQVCTACGYYKGKQVETKKKDK
ncbi:MAG: 50S ribosomal protein L32 [Candidatus Wallbacteria bacterium]|nr:50S ribosomal protein L32 [Candidatus Wallbacteria bacterium]